MVKLVRLARMRVLFKVLVERISSERLIICLHIIKILLVIIGIAHVTACIWYGIGTMEALQSTTPGEGTWVELAEIGHRGLLYRYTTCLHWALSQFTGGMDEVRAANAVERIFVIVVFICAFLVAALFISSLTSSMTRLHILSSHQTRQLSILRRYMVQNKITDKTMLRVQRNAQHHLHWQERVMAEASVELLSLVSEPLRVELHYEMYARYLDEHPFFHRYIEECPQVMRKVCHSATALELVSASDILFHAGERPDNPRMYIVVDGRFEYVPLDGEISYVKAGQWIAEASLWTEWVHAGILKACEDCRIIQIDARKFRSIVCQFSHSDFDPCEYAQKFIINMNDGGQVCDLYGAEPTKKRRANVEVSARTTLFANALNVTKKHHSARTALHHAAGGQSPSSTSKKDEFFACS